MKSIVENLSSTRVKLAIEVPFDELKDKFDAAYKRIGAQIRVPGFRPGKVPPRIIEQRVGRGAVVQEVVNEAVPEALSSAITENEIRPLGQPEIEISEITDAEFKFTASLDIRPEFTVPDLGSIEVELPDVDVSDDEVDSQMDDLRARFATLKGVDRPAAEGDFVSIDLDATVDGEPVEGGSANGLSYEIGSGQLIPGLDEQLVGLAADEEKTFTSSLVAGEHAGKDAEVTVKVKSVKERELPELDEDFAAMASEFDTIEELRADLRKRIEGATAIENINSSRDAAMEKLIEATEFDLPEGALANEIEARKHDAVHSFNHDEDALTKWVESEGKTREEFDKELEDNAAKALRSQLILDEIVRTTEIEIDDSDLSNYVMQQAQRYGMVPQQFIQEVSKAGQIPALMDDVRRAKAVDHLVGSVVVKNSAGEVVDIAELHEEAMAPFAKLAEMANASAEDADADDDADAVDDGEQGESDDK